MKLERQLLDKGWEFKQATALNDSTAKEFLPVAQFPTVAHIDLLYHGLIKDPYIDTNELSGLWVNDADWTYRTTFPSPDIHRSSAKLVFDGLDTIVSVYLNSKLILESQNMHVSHEANITKFLSEDVNVLELKFKNAPEFAKAEMKRIGYKGNGVDVHFGGPERLFVRKAQYHWGWDWGPALNTSGPWKEIWLETYTARIEEFVVRQEVSDDLKTAEITITGKADGLTVGEKVLLHIEDPDRKSVGELEAAVNQDGTFRGRITLSKGLQLWYPFTYGASPLYNITASIASYHSVSQKLGLRRLRLLQHSLEDQPGSSFLFEINNVRVFAGGSCWIPGDNLLPRFTRERYEEWLLLAKAGNQVMIRVWGGGIVEDDVFYEICDREGILVWQDFLFACGDYPASDDFIENFKVEAEQQVKRVGYHACLAIWAGNNEDYMLAERWGWGYDIHDEDGPWDNSRFPARKIYERVLPEICGRLAGDVPYWRSSPYGGKETVNDMTVGDTHLWNVWHGNRSPYQDYRIYTSRFVSEFGFESAPNIRTLHKAITTPSERHWQSRTFDAHDKGPGHQRTYALYSGENFRFQMHPLSSFVYTTQFLQAEAMSYAYNHWRREFRGPGKEYCSGILVWQLNDIWPGMSWALVDVDLNPKPSYFITKRALAKVVVGMERVVTREPHYITTGYLPEKAALEIWAVNGFLTPLDVVLKILAVDIETGEEVPLKEEKERTLVLKPNQSNEITRIEIPNAEQTVIVAYLDDPEGNRLARWVSWPEPLKFVRFRKDLKVEVEVDGEQVVLSTNAPAKGVVVSVPVDHGDDAKFEDNFIDLVPGEVVRIKTKGLEGREVTARWLCDWENENGLVVNRSRREHLISIER